MPDQPLYAALDVSLEKMTICIMARDGSLIQEAVVPSDPTMLAASLVEHRDHLERIGLEAGPLSEWIVRGLGLSRSHGRPDADAPGPGGMIGSDRQDRPQGRSRHGPSAAQRLVPACPRQDHGCSPAART
jgi:hypothetical protein